MVHLKFVNMKKHLVFFAAFFVLSQTHAYGHYRTSSNPAISNYSIQRQPVAVQTQSLGLSSLLPQNRVFSSPSTTQSTLRTSTTTTQVTLPQTTAAAPATGHYHQMPSYPQPQVPGPSVAHAHSPQFAPPPVPAPGFPHAHSGHPYIAPAVVPQRMTYQQIIEYLVNTNGVGLSSVLSNGSGNTLLRCKAYCDTLPPSPTCDDTNVLYRNECEARCVNKTTSTNTLRYGICCCSDNDFNYTTNTARLYSSTAGANLCLSTCVFNCLGGETPIETEHSSVSLAINRSNANCASIS